jgi:UDP-N-acetylenolpyruvoylglucosamine reductase
VTAVNLDGKIRELGRGEISFGYRGSSLTDFAILRATFELRRADRKDLRQRMIYAIADKKATQPLGASSGGGAFFEMSAMSAPVS